MNRADRAVRNLLGRNDVPAPHSFAVTGLLGGLAEFERELIRSRTSEGRARAVAKGVKLGRKPTLTRHQQQEALKRRNSGKETYREIAASYNVSAATISRLKA